MDFTKEVKIHPEKVDNELKCVSYWHQKAQLQGPIFDLLSKYL